MLLALPDSLDLSDAICERMVIPLTVRHPSQISPQDLDLFVAALELPEDNRRMLGVRRGWYSSHAILLCSLDGCIAHLECQFVVAVTFRLLDRLNEFEIVDTSNST